LYGVSVADMKVISKTIKGEQELACELYDTGNYDAMYLAGIVADGKQMTKKQLQSWARGADWQLISEYTVPWVASESAHGHDLAMKWIDSKQEHVAACGWCTYAGLVATTPDADLDLAEIKSLLDRETGQVSHRYIAGGANRNVGVDYLHFPPRHLLEQHSLSAEQESRLSKQSHAGSASSSKAMASCRQRLGPFSLSSGEM
jgi:hypothetical protein